MKNRKALSGIVAVMLIGMGAQADLIPYRLDISSAFNYDAIGTDAERLFADSKWTDTNAMHGMIANEMGNHAIRYGTVLQVMHYYAPQLPTDYMVGKYEVGLGVTPAQGYTRYGATSWEAGDPDPTKVNQAMALGTGASNVPQTATIALTPTDQQRYHSINFLFVGTVYNTMYTQNYSASIEVRYDGEETWNTLFSQQNAERFTGLGTFNSANGSSGNANRGEFAYKDANVDYDLWNVAHTSSQYHGTSGSGGARRQAVLSGNRYLWEFTTDLPLDPTKTLEEVRFTLNTSDSRGYQNLYLFAATAMIPEPGSISLLGLGALALAIARRRRR